MKQYWHNLVNKLLERTSPTTITINHNNNIKLSTNKCLINTITQNTTTDGNQTHSSIQKFEIWNVLIDVFIENTTELMIKSNTTYTNQLIINQRQSTLAKYQPYKTKPTITSIITKTTINNNNWHKKENKRII